LLARTPYPFAEGRRRSTRSSIKRRPPNSTAELGVIKANASSNRPGGIVIALSTADVRYWDCPAVLLPHPRLKLARGAKDEEHAMPPTSAHSWLPIALVLHELVRHRLGGS